MMIMYKIFKPWLVLALLMSKGTLDGFKLRYSYGACFRKHSKKIDGERNIGVGIGLTTC